MAETAEEFERELDQISPGTRETLIVAARKDDTIWNDTMVANGLDVSSGSRLRDYIRQTYDPAGEKLR